MEEAGNETTDDEGLPTDGSKSAVTVRTLLSRNGDTRSTVPDRLGSILGRALPGAAGRVLPALVVAALASPFLVSPTGEGAAEEHHELHDHPNQQIAVASERQRVAPPPVFVPDPFPTESSEAPPPAGQPIADPRPVVADDVEPVRPDLLVRPDKVDSQGLFAALEIDGVRHLTGARELEVTVHAPVGPQQLKLLVVDPIAFRPLTPDATAKARAVWERLVEGEMVVRHDVAQKLQFVLGETVPVTGADGDQLGVRIGAFASNGTPPLADALIPWSLGAELGATSPNILVVAVSDEQRTDAVRERLVDVLGGNVTELEQPVEQRARLVGAGSTTFEPFTYVDHGDGMITIDPAWVRRNIVYADVPVFGTVRCHKAMIPQLRSALQEVVDAGLAGQIDTSDYGGCWVPRHILFDPDRPISMHAWGLAIDFNVHTNMYGDSPTLSPRIVHIFQRWGFEWGGHWSTPDGMHFELNALIK